MVTRTDPLCLAVKDGPVEIVETLLNYEATVDKDIGKRALNITAEYNFFWGL